jgi:hypothetical protein
MPCNDVTEVLTLKFDQQDRIVGYTLVKLTCGGSVTGRSLIKNWVKHRTADEVLRLTHEQLLSEARCGDEVEEYLHLKHLFSIQSALAAMMGKSGGGPQDFCVINTLASGPEGTELIAELNIEVITEKIRACGRCSTCGSDGRAS